MVLILKPRLGRLQQSAHHIDRERSRQAEGPRECPLTLGEGETREPRVQVSTAARKAPTRIGQNLALSGDETEQPVLRIPDAATNAGTRRHATVSRVGRQASHVLSYPHDQCSRSPDTAAWAARTGRARAEFDERAGLRVRTDL